MIRNMNTIGPAIRGDLKFPKIATKDIAQFAVNQLLKKTWPVHR